VGLVSFARSTQTDITVAQTDTLTGAKAVETFTITDLSPSWSASGHYRGGMGIPAAARAAEMLADLVGGLTWDAYRDDPNEDLAHKVYPRPLVLEQPAPPRPLISTVVSMVMDYLWHGNAIGIKVGFDERNNSSGFIPVSAESAFIRQVRPGDGLPFPIGSFAYAASLMPGLPQYWYGQDEVIHIMGPSEPHAVRGMGVLENHLATLNLAHEHVRQAGNATGAGVPTGVLQSDDPDLTQSDANEISDAWMTKQRDRKVAVLNATTHYQALGWNPTEAQLVQARELSMHEIALIFGLDPSWLGKSNTSRTYSNVEQEAVNLLKFGKPGGLVRRFEAGFSSALAPGTYAKANLDALLRADTLSRYQAHVLAFGKWLTADEIRRIEDRPPLTSEQKTELAALAPPAPGAGAAAGPGAPGPPPGAPGHKAPGPNKGGQTGPQGSPAGSKAAP
jgi:phage portal protein BeeE